MEEEEIEFNEELYLQNIKENDFSEKEQDGIGDEDGIN
jgi:hypothetical protein